MQRRAVIPEYVNKIIITDDGIEVQCIGDYDMTGGATPNHEILVYRMTRERMIELNRY